MRCRACDAELEDRIAGLHVVEGAFADVLSPVHVCASHVAEGLPDRHPASRVELGRRMRALCDRYESKVLMLHVPKAPA